MEVGRTAVGQRSWPGEQVLDMWSQDLDGYLAGSVQFLNVMNQTQHFKLGGSEAAC